MSTAEYTNAQAAWGSASADEFFIHINLPSGLACKAKKLEMEDIIELNLVNELDTFSSLFDDDEKKAAKEEESELDFVKRLSEGGQFSRLKTTMNKVIVQTVVEPKVLPEPKDGESRVEGAAYVDRIGFADKMTIFGRVFEGLSAMSDFREGQDPGVGAVEEKPIVEGPSV